MKIQSIILIIITLQFTNTVQATNGQHKSIGDVLKKLSDANNLVGTHFVAVVNENGLSFLESYSNEEKPLKRNSQFLVASHTKSMTSTLLAILHANDEIDLFKPINKYDNNLLSNKKVQTENITLHKLLTHTAGFTSIQHTFKTAFLGYDDKDELIEALNYKTLVAPDFKFRYSNTGPIVASMFVESELDRSWNELIESRLFAPLGMTNTTSIINDGILPSIITGRNGKVFHSGHYKNNKTMHASGGIVSTVDDLANWLKVNINQETKAFSDENVFKYLHTKQVEQDKKYFTYQRTGYSLGWDIANYNGEKLLTRFGNYGGYSIHVSFMPERKLGVIAFTNQDIAYALPHVIANYAYNSILNKNNKLPLLEQESKRLDKSISKSLSTAPDVSQIVTSSNISSKIFGTYINDQKWPTLNIFLEDEQVKVSWGDLSGLLLKADDKYIIHLGSLQRNISIKTMTDDRVELKNGSLIYTKS